MATDTATSQVALSLFHAYSPTTFVERGVAVPFTTPVLTGARARPGERGTTEIIVPNPAGGRGVYILPWGGICQLCRPTVHDTVLNQRVSALRSVTPDAIQKIARAVAAEGLAGRAPLAAAAAAAESDREEELVTNFNLLLALIEQMAPVEFGAMAAHRQATDDLKARARRATEQLAPRIGRTPDAIAIELEELARIFAPLGVPGQQPTPRLIRVLNSLRELRDGMQQWTVRHADETGAAAEMIATVADVTIACAERTVADAHLRLGAMADLLAGWQARPEEIMSVAARPSWLLDGWDQICLIWRRAETELKRVAAIFEMAVLVPVIPREASEWVGMTVDTDVVTRFRRTVRRNEDWRTGANLELIASNEQLRALTI